MKPIKFFTILFFAAQFVFSAQVKQTKNNKVIIDNQDDIIEVGQDYYLVNIDNKKVAIINISAVKNGKSIATIIKGKSNGDETLQLKSGPSSSEKVSQDAETSENTTPTLYKYSAKKISLLVNLFNNSMTAKESDGASPNPHIEDVDMKGTSFGFTAALDRPLNSWFALRGTLGYEPFKASGTANYNGCDSTSSTNCTAEMNYLSAGAYARFDVYRAKALMTWLAVGGTTRIPISKSSTALKTDDIKMTATYAIALGADYFISNKFFIPFSLEQQTFLNSDTVKASVLAIRFGIGMPY
ncbi:MAG: hypothetical protein WA160_04275 [Pseudobdellovibrio sp.]